MAGGGSGLAVGEDAVPAQCCRAKRDEARPARVEFPALPSCLHKALTVSCNFWAHCQDTAMRWPAAGRPSRGLRCGQIIPLRFENVGTMSLIWVSDEKVVFKTHLFDL